MNLDLVLRRFTIRTRMLGAIAMVLLLLLLVGATGLLAIREVDAIGAAFVSGTHAETVTLAKLRTALGDVRRYEKDLLINDDSEAQQKAYRPKWDAALADTRSAAKLLAQSNDPAEAAAARRIDALLQQYGERATPVLRQIEVGGFNDAPVANKAMGPAKQLVHEAGRQIDVVQRALDATVATSVQSRQAAADHAKLLYAGALLLAVLLVVPLTLTNMASICGPIDRARALAERIANGDLSTREVDSGADESARLLAALDAMQTALGGIVGQVKQSAESIQVASAEVASGNTDLSQRTEQAASSLQQTASSIEQLTGNVRQSADAAAQANQLAASASAVAQRGGQVVSQVVQTMDQINHSSKRIADIIGTIDSIAFQTNILALNAAVEAARAGEQGRGFAVVASEVRSLAQRSAEAAREIKTLIGTSVDKVEAGARLVQDAGSTMAEIVASVQRVTDVIGEISAAAAEQSHGIVSVNGAVNSLDQMTQQNAALVEQSAAAAESLKDQAQRLSGVVNHFDLGQAAPGATPRALPRPAGASPARKLAHRPTPVRAGAAKRPPTTASSAASPASANFAAPAAKAAKAAKATESAAAGSDWKSF